MYNVFKYLIFTTVICNNSIQINANDIVDDFNKKAIIDCCSYSNSSNMLITHQNSSIYSTANTKNRPIRILSLSGGGTRAYIQAKFLEKFYETAQIDNMNEYFDLIAGSSAGGLNALAISNGINTQCIQKFFRTKTPWIFTTRSMWDVLSFSTNASYPSRKPNLFQKLFMMMYSNPFYKAVSTNSNYGDIQLRNNIDEMFGDKTLRLIKTPILLTAYNDSSNYPMIFTNVNLPNMPNTFNDAKIVDALMATMSAPVYFPRTCMSLSSNSQYKDQYITDGGIFLNNPDLLAFTAAKYIYPSAQKYCILSIGTGESKTKLSLNLDDGTLYPGNLVTFSYNLYNLALQNLEIANNIVFEGINNTSNNTSYYRFNITLDNNQDCNLDTSTSEFFDYLDNEVEKQYNNDYQKIKEFINKLKDEDVK